MTSTSQKKPQTTRPQNNRRAVWRTVAVLALAVICIVLVISSEPDNPGTPAVTVSPAAPTTVPAAVKSSAEAAEEALKSVPVYAGDGILVLNSNVPFFTQEEIDEAKRIGSYEHYGDLDELGRCTAAMANLSLETMPAEGEHRGSISEIHPTGWVQKRYDCVDSESVMTRTHLIGWMLGAENANKKNLITGTRYMNSDIMTIYELETARYIEGGKDRHVLYRVTPFFDGNNRMADGVLMEGLSLDDDGQSICFCVFLYNIQPGIDFDYSTGESWYTGIFFDTGSNSVRTDGLDLQKYAMEGNTITDPRGNGPSEGTWFFGDTAMIEKWAELGYLLDLDQTYAEAA